MKSEMYDFVLNMYIKGDIDDDGVKSFVPEYITQEECDLMVIGVSGD